MIAINDLQFKYPRKSLLFRGLSMSVEPGHIIGLLGKNGEGKTSLMKLIAGQMFPTKGEMKVLGEEPARRKVSFLGDVYYLAENNPTLKGCSVGNYFAAVAPFYPNFSQSEADSLMQEFELDYKMRMDKMSQGQQKKAAIALALSLGTHLLLLDEPTNGLDIPSKSLFRRLLAKYLCEDRIIMISTHQVRDLEQIIDYLVVMQENQITLTRSISELSDKFTFRPVQQGDTPLYEEMTPAGRFGVFAKEKDEPESVFSTELLFNALTSNKEAILRTLQQ